MKTIIINIKRTIASLPFRGMKGFLIALALLLWGLGGSSCKENEEVSEYANWPSRNQHYVDSIAELAKTGTDGWSKMIAFNLIESEENHNLGNQHYIYIKKMENGEGEKSPEYNDSIRVHYLGRLIPSASYPQGYIFGKSYNTYNLDEDTDVPALLSVAENVVGFATATMNMVVGDRWKVVVPYYLGYGTTTNSSGSIPAYSTLIFDIKLARIHKYKVDTNTTWN